MSDKEQTSGNTDLENAPAGYYSSHDNDIHDAAEDERPSRDSLGKIYTGGDNNEYIYIGRQKFLKSDLYQAFGGTLNPGLAPAPVHKFANPAPLGLSAFALTTFVLSMFNARAQGITVPNVVVGCAMFYGGLVQLIAGIWEIALENTFGGTALCSYGGFWLSFAAIYIPWFGILDAYEDNEADLNNALGFYLLGWAIFTFGLTVCTMKSTVMFFLLFFLLALTFLLLSIGHFAGRLGVTRAGGVLGVVVAFIAWYNAYAGVATKQNSYVLARPFPLPSTERVIF
ncbi:ady2p [Saccharomyces arboricola H-6]|uniref:Ady2p n=1 Tax=Saccharomyces arboricola (strain H-6 / AS 2.3317 / CBS 10644) TaxID=1160507 RepID=J8Q497_SACAR|nr:ady2p [Saccharomyces arboricola H-6]